MNAHAPLLLSTAVPVIPADPAPTWGALLLELRDAKADFLAKSDLLDSVALGREPTEHEFAIGNAAQDRDMAAIRAVQAYAPTTLTEFLEKAALFADPHLHLGMNEAVTALARDAQALQAADAELLRQDQQLGMRFQIERLVCETSGAPDEILDAVVAWTGEVASAMMRLPAAVTLEGMQAKARAIAWCFTEERTEFSGPHEVTQSLVWADRFFAELLHGTADGAPPVHTRPASTAVQAISGELQQARARTRQADEQVDAAKAAGDEPALQTAEEAFSRLADAEGAIEDRLVAEPGRSIADLLIKAQLAVDHDGGTAFKGHDFAPADDLGTLAARAIVRDLCAMVGLIVPEKPAQVAF